MRRRGSEGGSNLKALASGCCDVHQTGVAICTGCACVGTVRNRAEFVERSQIIIEGFKSYKEQQALDEFSPRINVVGALNMLSGGYILCVKSWDAY